MENWHFPDSLLFPALYHHDPPACPKDHRRYAIIVWLANSLCKKARIGESGNSFIPKPERIGEKLGVSPEDVEAIVQELKERRSTIEGFLEIIG
jgi:hypothetical protein